MLLYCDSQYKFFGPHIGILYGRHDLLESLNAYKVRPAPKQPPGKFETVTQNYEGIAGLLEYLQWLGQEFGESYAEEFDGKYKGRSLELRQGLVSIREYEYELSRALMDIFQSVPSLQPHERKGTRPNLFLNVGGLATAQTRRGFGRKRYLHWNGNYYALTVTERLGLKEHGGMLRVGAVHYNTLGEVEKSREVLSHWQAKLRFSFLFTNLGMENQKQYE
ncbi:MAG: hypothetical protein DWQ07_10940 [Chloroflexi bacterium]|nr:MAG: hypothetical protein DWQ07_10940 [Chloroflexota bacterium]MBL1192770.1 hypothetical protein [Chloroflexota bacterium]NOH10064.1 hypothetical protein [Chloroflexota bacterium]